MFVFIHSATEIYWSLLIDSNARVASAWTGITGIQIDINKICTYLDTLTTYKVPPLLLPLNHLEKF